MSDLISRQAAIDVLSIMQGIVAENGVRKGISMAWQQIKALPSAEQPTGHWINIRDGNIGDCDQCGARGRAWMNFCPICGADMREPAAITRDTVHQAIDNTIWSDTVDTAEMHKIVAELEVEHES